MIGCLRVTISAGLHLVPLHEIIKHLNLFLNAIGAVSIADRYCYQFIFQA